jgi:glycosyltransferase involved in cell wall biosynthesis
MKKVLYISYDGLTDPLGQSQVLPYVVQLEKEGYSFTIISFEKKQRFENEENVIRSIMEGKKINWVPLQFTSKPPVLSKIYDRYRMWKTALALHRKMDFDIIHCRSYVAAEVGLKMKKKYGVSFLFDMRGFWADEKVDNGQWDLDKPLFKKIYYYYKQKEKEFLLNADGIVSLTEAARNYLRAQPLYNELSIEVIPCCADLEHFDFHKVDADKAMALKKELGIPGAAKIISYVGSVGGWYMTKEMFVFFKLLLAKDGDYHMLILTKDDPGKVKSEASSFGIAEDKLTVTYVERKSLPLYMSLSLFSVFFIRNTFSKIASSPTKYAELMGMGIPVVCNEIGDMGFIIEQTKSGLLVNHFDQHSLEKITDEVGELTAINQEAIRENAIEFFDLNKGSQKYNQLYKRLSLKRQQS